MQSRRPRLTSGSLSASIHASPQPSSRSVESVSSASESESEELAVYVSAAKAAPKQRPPPRPSSAVERALQSSLVSPQPFLSGIDTPRSTSSRLLSLRSLHAAIAKLQEGTHPVIANARRQFEAESQLEEESVGNYYRVERLRLSTHLESELKIVDEDYVRQLGIVRGAILHRIAAQQRLLHDFECVAINRRRKKKKKKKSAEEKKKRDALTRPIPRYALAHFTGSKRERKKTLRPMRLYEPPSKRRKVMDHFRDLDKTIKLDSSVVDDDLTEMESAIRKAKKIGVPSSSGAVGAGVASASATSASASRPAHPRVTVTVVTYPESEGGASDSEGSWIGEEFAERS